MLEQYLATHILLDKGRAVGVRAMDCVTGFNEEFECKCLILATGGAGRLYKFNTNSEIATGDGVSLAFKAGAQITDMEFYQFHPTALNMPGVEPFLISEAVRGEGGILKNIQGRRFMQDYAQEGELAPRDVVARSIFYEMTKTGADHVFLDVTHLPRSLTTSRFPHIYRYCLEHGLDITKTSIPVAPSAHYMMGGVKVNTWGETSVPGLFATGETACTGVHGANRLASNSMLEVLVFSKRIMEKVQNGNPAVPARKSSDNHLALLQRKQAKTWTEPSQSHLQSLMWDRVGILRDGSGLLEAATILAAWQQSLSSPTERSSHELHNLVTIGRLVTEAALIREESRGAHFRSDFPQSSPAWQHHIVFTKD